MILAITLVFLALMLIGFDVGWSMILAAVLGMLFKDGNPIDTVMVPLTMLNSVDTVALIAVPMFILAGELMNRGGVTQRIVDWALTIVGHLRGSLSQVSIMTNLVMAGVSGSAIADATATGAALIPAMKREGYRPGYAGAVIAAGAMLGPIIPPSIPLVVYAVIANESVIRLFLAGIVPGALLAAGYMVLCALIARRRNLQARPRSSWGERVQATRRSIWALLMPVIILGGIRFGVVTDTEASAVVVVYALLIALLVYRDLKFREVGAVIYDAGRTAAGVLFLLAAAGPFAWLISESRIAQGLTDGILAITTDPFLVLLIVNLLLLAVGMILEPLPAMIIFLPALIPLQQAIGIDPVQFGMVMVMNLMIGMLTPPVGLLLFVVAAIGRMKVQAVLWEVLPFLAWSLIVLVLISAFPGLTLWLPSIGFGN